MKKIIFKFRIYIMIFYLLINVQSGHTQSVYFEDPETVPLFEATITTNTQKNIYWDLSEISGNRLDLVGGVVVSAESLPVCISKSG